MHIRAGVHTAEIVRVGNDVRGIGVHVAARVAAAAGADEVLVSATTKDLVAGSGLVFHDRGEFELKGVDDAAALRRQRLNAGRGDGGDEVAAPREALVTRACSNRLSQLVVVLGCGDIALSARSLGRRTGSDISASRAIKRAINAFSRYQRVSDMPGRTRILPLSWANVADSTRPAPPRTSPDSRS